MTGLQDSNAPTTKTILSWTSTGLKPDTSVSQSEGDPAVGPFRDAPSQRIAMPRFVQTWSSGSASPVSLAPLQVQAVSCTGLHDCTGDDAARYPPVACPHPPALPERRRGQAARRKQASTGSAPPNSSWQLAVMADATKRFARGERGGPRCSKSSSRTWRRQPAFFWFFRGFPLVGWTVGCGWLAVVVGWKDISLSRVTVFRAGHLPVDRRTRR